MVIMREEDRKREKGNTVEVRFGKSPSRGKP